MDTNSPTEKWKPGSFVQASASSIRRKRAVFNKEQLRILINHFQRNPYPGIEEREELSGKITIDESRIQVWFQNRRARQSAQHKKQLSLVTSKARKRMDPGNPSPNQVPEEDIHYFSKHNFSLPNATRSDSWSGPDEPSLETASRSSCCIEKGETSVPGAACSGYNISQSQLFDSSKTMTSSTEPEPASQGSSREHTSCWAQQGIQGPENRDIHTSFFRGVKPPLHCQQQVYSHYHPLTFQCTQVSPFQLQQPYPQQSDPQQPHTQKPPTLLPLMPQIPTFQLQQQSLQQSPQEHPSQTQLSPLMRREEQPDELFLSFNQQEQLQLINRHNRTAGLGSTMLLPDGHLPAHPGDLDTTLRDLDDILRDLPFPQKRLTPEVPDVIYKQMTDILTVLNN